MGGLRLRDRCQAQSPSGTCSLRPAVQAGIRPRKPVPGRHPAHTRCALPSKLGTWSLPDARSVAPAAQAGIRPRINVPSQPSALLRLNARLQLDARPQPNARQRRKFMIEVLKVLSES